MLNVHHSLITKASVVMHYHPREANLIAERMEMNWTILGNNLCLYCSR